MSWREDWDKELENFIEGLASQLLGEPEMELGMNKKKISVELPEPPPAGGFACCPSGDTEYDEAMEKWHKKVNAVILEAIPRGYKLQSSEVKEEKIVRHYANIVVEKS